MQSRRESFTRRPTGAKRRCRSTRPTTVNACRRTCSFRRGPSRLTRQFCSFQAPGAVFATQQQRTGRHPVLRLHPAERPSGDVSGVSRNLRAQNQRLLAGASQEVLLTTEWYKDASRSLDYLDTRSDIDHGKMGYLGVSMGSADGVIITAMLRERLKTAIFLDGGYFWTSRRQVGTKPTSRLA